MHVRMVLATLGAVAAAAAPMRAQAEPYRDLIDACQADPADIDHVASLLVNAGWDDVSSAVSYAAFVRETLHHEARAKLSAASFPDPWTDASVARSYPSTMATTLAELDRHIEDNVSIDVFPDPTVTQIVLDDQDHSAVEVLYGPENAPFIHCWLLGTAEENQTLADEFRSNALRAEKGYSVTHWPLEGLRASVTVLSPHALQEDPHFPVRYDLSFAFSVQKG